MTGKRWTLLFKVIPYCHHKSNKCAQHNFYRNLNHIFKIITGVITFVVN